MNRTITSRLNSSSNWPFGLFLSEQIWCQRRWVCCRTFASRRFGAMPAEMVRPVASSTCARSWATTSDALILCSAMYGVMLESDVVVHNTHLR